MALKPHNQEGRQQEDSQTETSSSEDQRIETENPERIKNHTERGEEEKQTIQRGYEIKISGDRPKDMAYKVYSTLDVFYFLDTNTHHLNVCCLHCLN